MQLKKSSKLEKVAFLLVLLMALLQGFYAVYAFIDPSGFATLRGTELIANGDLDWVRIYASRTLFVSLIIGFLLCKKNYKILMWAALFGVVMPLTDGLLAYTAQAATAVVLKHAATVIYLLLTTLVLKLIVARNNRT